MLAHHRHRLLAVLLGLAMLAVPVTATAQEDPLEVALVEVDEPVDAAFAVSQLTYTPWTGDVAQPAGEVVIGTAAVFADNLAAGALAGPSTPGGRPLLLNDRDDGVDGTLLDEIARVTNGAEGVTVRLLGGEAAQGPGVVADLDAAGYSVDRLAGPTRLETAIAVAEATDHDQVMIVRAFPAPGGEDTQAFADSLTAGGVAATEGYDIVFSQTEVLSTSTAAHLEAAGYTRAVIVGGTAALFPAVEEAVRDLIPDTTRVAGASRFDTQIALNELRTGPVAPAPQIVDGTDPDAWGEAFALANLSGLLAAPIVLSAGGELPAQTVDYIEQIGARNPAFTGLLGPGEGDDFECSDGALGCLLLWWVHRAGEVRCQGTFVCITLPFPKPQHARGLVTERLFDPVGYALEVGGERQEIRVLEGPEYYMDFQSVSADAFLAAVTPGDEVVVNAPPDGDLANDSHLLTNGPFTGIAGDVDLADARFAIVGYAEEPAGGVIDPDGNAVPFLGNLHRRGVSGSRSWGGSADRYIVDGQPSDRTAWEADLSEGDLVETDIPSLFPVFGRTWELTNGVLHGFVDDIEPGVPVRFSLRRQSIESDAFGDDPTSDADELFEAGPDDLLTIGGETVDEETFAATIEAGQTVTYQRQDGQEHIALPDATPFSPTAPPTLVGTVANPYLDNDGSCCDAIFLTTGADNTFVVPYDGEAAGTEYVVDGEPATEDELEAAMTAGDLLAITSPDEDCCDDLGGTIVFDVVERVELTNQPLTGFVAGPGGLFSDNDDDTPGDDLCDGFECRLDIVNAQGGRIATISYAEGTNPFYEDVPGETIYRTSTEDSTSTVTEDEFNDALAALTDQQRTAVRITVSIEDPEGSRDVVLLVDLSGA